MVVRLLKSLLLLSLASCASQQANDSPVELADGNKVNYVELIKSDESINESQLLDIGIQTFSVEQENTGAATIGDWIFQEILDIESQYLPVLLRNTLVESNQWGAVRVLPKSDPSIDLQLSGAIKASDGTFLKIAIKAQDSSGRIWLEKDYSSYYDGGDLKPNHQRETNPNYRAEYEDPFQSLYNQIANDLLKIKQGFSESEISNLRRLTEMVYASDLSPDAFAEMLAEDNNGIRQIIRLPAENDSILGRVGRMRLRHHLFIDTLDEYYSALQADMQEVYDLWRVYSLEQILLVDAEQTNAGSTEGGFMSIANNYYKYTANKLFEQEWNELAQGFTNEVAPAILELNNQVYGLSGSVESQYDEWRILLRQFYIQERGLP